MSLAHARGSDYIAKGAAARKRATKNQSHECTQNFWKLSLYCKAYHFNHNAIMKHAGFALLEVLIAMSMAGCVLSALLLDQMNSLRAMHHVFLQTIAFIQLENFSEMICATPSSVAHDDQSFLDWDAENKMLLPHGSGAWRVISNHRYFIQMTWFEKTWRTKSIDVIC